MHSIRDFFSHNERMITMASLCVISFAIYCFVLVSIGSLQNDDGTVVVTLDKLLLYSALLTIDFLLFCFLFYYIWSDNYHLSCVFGRHRIEMFILDKYYACTKCVRLFIKAYPIFSDEEEYIKLNYRDLCLDLDLTTNHNNELLQKFSEEEPIISNEDNFNENNEWDKLEHDR